MKPPASIDNAEVVAWAWSGPSPFFVMSNCDGTSGPSIHGLAICKYANGSVYRFSCNQDWETENDAPFATIRDAMTAVPPNNAIIPGWNVG